jgi:protein SCO1/2
MIVPEPTAIGPPVIGRTVTTGEARIGGPFTLVSTDGESVTEQSFRGKYLLAFFGFTFCPDVCPTALSNISVALKKLGGRASALQSLFITVDPQRDTQAMMTEYLKSFDPHFLGLTGSQEQIDRVLKAYRVYAERQKPEGQTNDYLVSHSGYVYLMSPQGKFVDVITGSASGDEITEWLGKHMPRPYG